MALYCWDLGFDGNSVPEIVTNQFYLQNGFVSRGSTIRMPTTPVNLSIGDAIIFDAFNVTNGATDGYSITTGSIIFQNAESGQTTPAPFNDPRVEISNNIGTIPLGSFGQTSEISLSTIFSAGTNPPVEFPVWNIIPETNPLVLTSNGRFLMRVELTIQRVGEQPRTFVVDPEMIIGGAG